MDLIRQIVANVELEESQAEKAVGAFLTALGMSVDGATFEEGQAVVPNSESYMGRALMSTARSGEMIGFMGPAPAPAAPAPSAVTVEAVLARSVLDRMPQDSGIAFPAEVGELVLWTRVTGAEGQTLSHVWFFGDTEVSDVPLSIGGSPWRTWSRKTIPLEATGAWHVEIRDSAGNVLKRMDFTVGQ